MINSAQPDAAYVTLQGFEALKVLANGNATKIVVPSDIQNVSGLLTSISEVIRNDNIAITAKTKDSLNSEAEVIDTLASSSTNSTSKTNSIGDDNTDNQ